MIFPEKYKVTNQSSYSIGDYELVPIRYEDRLDIMNWRNAQIFHLRQKELLTVEMQNKYFDTVVSKLYNEELPGQILFSYLEKGKCIGYGGLVHIDWASKNAEISFIIDPALEKDSFNLHWDIYLSLLYKCAFDDINLHKIYTYAFDIRPYLYEALEKGGLQLEARLKEHFLFNGEFKDVLIHSKIKDKYTFRNFTDLSYDEALLVQEWRNDESIRKWMYNTDIIELNQHLGFLESLKNNSSKKYFLVYRDLTPVGVFNLIDYDGVRGEWGYYIAPQLHSGNIGVEFYFYVLKYCFEVLNVSELYGYALASNKAANSFNSLFGFESELVHKDGFEEPFLKRLLTSQKWFSEIKENSRIKRFLKLTI